MNDYQPIACHLYDYIEIACMYQFDVELSMRDGQQIQGRAMTTHTGQDRREYLILASQLKQNEVDLSRVRSMRALSPNAHFDRVDFTRR